jgi:hydroxyisourate hydrolase
MRSSQLTTHVLDTSAGRPGAMMTIRLMEQQNGSTWQTMAQGITNTDGRIADLLPAERLLVPGSYKLAFDTGGYFRQNDIKGFYPLVEIQFTVADEQHYHVPLLINPFGYSTYRGS